jgi:hypothetical protein
MYPVHINVCDQPEDLQEMCDGDVTNQAPTIYGYARYYQLNKPIWNPKLAV